MASNPYGRHIGSVTDVHGRELKVGTDCDGVTLGGYVLGPEARDDFALLYFQADAEAKAYAGAEAREAREEGADGGE